MKVVITGSSGLVGTALKNSLVRDGHTVVRLLRSGSGSKKENAKGSGERRQEQSGKPALKNEVGKIVDVVWNPNTCDLEGEPFGEDQEKIEGCDAVVNLAGASSASAIGYYGDRGDEVLTEESKPGDAFLARLAQEWEAEAVKAEALGLRVARLRFGIILAKHGGALPQMMRPFKFGVGGRIGSGQQWTSWITLQDVVSVIRNVLENRAISGAVNVVAPQPVRNADFAQALGRAMHRPAILPTPAFALEFALGEMAEALLLASQRVMPSRLEQLGHRFSQRDLGSALASVLAER